MNLSSDGDTEFTVSLFDAIKEHKDLYYEFIVIDFTCNNFYTEHELTKHARDGAAEAEAQLRNSESYKRLRTFGGYVHHLKKKQKIYTFKSS